MLHRIAAKSLAKRSVCLRFYSTEVSKLQRFPAIENIEASWLQLKPEEQLNLVKALDEAQKKSWTALTVNEKKAAYWIAFGPHGPRAPVLTEGSGKKVFFGIAAVMGTAAGLFALIRYNGGEKPQSFSKEWQEASNKRVREQNLEPITGMSSEGYKGKGMIQ